ncbi:MAG: hypothetical protein AAF722_00580 [Cyanobacteria bacterium P01_C01_bin.70]
MDRLKQSTPDEITFVISSLIGLHTATPYIDELKRRNIKIYFIVPAGLENESVLQGAGNIIIIDRLFTLNKVIVLLYNLSRLAFTRGDFSSVYQYWLQQHFAARSKLISFFGKALVDFFPKWNSNQVNQNLLSFFRLFIENKIPTERVVNVTFASKPYLFCADDLQVYTIVESWDHPGKVPVGYPSKKVFVWNQDLQADWREFQGDQHVEIAYPVKLDYVIRAYKSQQFKQLNQSYSPGFQENLRKNYMYSSTFGSNSVSVFFEEEKIFIHQVCKATENTDIRLLIKPKPNSRSGELDEFLAYPHVEIAGYQKSQGAGNYTLGKDYNEARLKELGESDLVINLGTTFALDAAAFGLPVLQLYVDVPSKFPYLSTISKYPHLARHLYCYEDCIFKISDGSDLAEQFKFLSSPADHMDKAKQFSKHLRQWIMPEMTLSEAVENVVDSILE